MGSPRSRTLSTTLKTAVLAPTPRATATTATNVRPGKWIISRSPKRKSRRKVSISGFSVPGIRGRNGNGSTRAAAFLVERDYGVDSWVVGGDIEGANRAVEWEEDF